MDTSLRSRFRRRRAISTLVGGVIVLSLLLAALGALVFLTRQYDQYEQTVNIMAQYRNQQLSEDLVVTSPGLTVVNSTTGTIPGWGGGCGIHTANPEYNCYNATINNVSTVGIQITRIYINSTGPAGSGCSVPNSQPCIINPTNSIAAYAFNAANEFLNPGETNHQLIFALPSSVALPNPNPGFPENTIIIVTSRGSILSFQWPFKPQVFGQSQSAFSSGIMKVAYTGAFDSKNEPGPVAGGSGGTVSSGYCHSETAEPYPAGVGYAEKLTGLESGTTVYGDSGILWFVNPWISGNGGGSSYNDVLDSVVNKQTTLYLYVIIVNTGTTAYTPTTGTIDLTWYGSNHFDGNLIGVYYNGNFYGTSPSIAPGASYYAIFQISSSIIMLDNPPGGGSPATPAQSTMFWGAASVTNALGSNDENQNFFSGTILLSGLWIRYEASSGSCA